ncbi:hypothetical protein FLK61_29440 [Paenalkalicoccus suaedae]|uniref:Uncharacterized protein n=1 Tax=Paenalkalicoccus suaedae TaxID=2592382 RepID=A0A859FE33_9BACI|nr:hypothetical protein [Paenalkalicoccus suaedae]QKS70854.1 hypothetical protein FLK61_29440 [Paenalkalicoccus suaedae]
MSDKTLRYVKWTAGTHLELVDTKLDEQAIYYDVEVTRAEEEVLRDLVANVQDGDVMPEHIFVHPFDETRDEKDKEELGDETQRLFAFIYEVGTKETKERIKMKNE